MKNKERMCFGIIIGTRAYFNSELAKAEFNLQMQQNSD